MVEEDADAGVVTTFPDWRVILWFNLCRLLLYNFLLLVSAVMILKVAKMVWKFTCNSFVTILTDKNNVSVVSVMVLKNCI